MKLVDAIQRRVAVVAIGPSTVRGQTVPGVVAAARDYLILISLSRFATGNAQTFAAELDDATDELRKSLPRGARSWGLARKCLNIFLRDAYYNLYIREQWALSRAEQFFEVPLDSIVAKALRAEATAPLPRWLGVKHLAPEASGAYQKAAAELACQRGIARVHLDTFLWVEGR